MSAASEIDSTARSAGGPVCTLRPADESDVEAIAEIWHRAWGDGHLGHVPDALLPFRTLRHFLERVPPRIPATTVATSGGRVVGFVTIHDDELEQIFVAAEARGGGVAGALLAAGEARIAREHERAWLAVVADNARARRFYERSGWRDAARSTTPPRSPAERCRWPAGATRRSSRERARRRRRARDRARAIRRRR
jgi:GNAT superfamily N-acetyltransferase